MTLVILLRSLFYLMPRVESELRSRDFEGMIAEMTITEEPIPVGIGIDLPQLLSPLDTVTLSEDIGSVAIPDSVAYAIPINILSNPKFEEDLSDWDTDTDSSHTLSIVTDVDNLPQVLASTSAQFDLSASSGSGTSTLSQSIDADIGDVVSFETWVNIGSIAGSASLRLLVQSLNSSGSVLDTSTIVSQDTVTTDWELLKVDDYPIPSGGKSITVEWTAPSVNAQAPILHYDIRYRIGTGTYTLVENINASLTSYTISGLAASTTYELQIRAVNRVGDGAWSTPAMTITTPA